MGFLDKLRGADAKNKAAAAGPIADPRFASAWEIVIGYGAGQPATEGDLAVQLGLYESAKTGGTVTYPTGSKGTGDMENATFKTMGELIEIAAEIASETAAPSDPATAPIDPLPTRAIHKETPPAELEAPISTLAPDAPEPDVATASAGPEGNDPMKPKKPSKKKAKDEPKVEATAPAPAPALVTDGKVNSEALKTLATDAVATALRDVTHGYVVYVDCAPSKGSVLSLNEWANGLFEKVRDVAGCDPRYSQEKPFSFGGWRGLVSDMALNVEENPLPSGVVALSLDARGNEVALEIARALENRADVMLVVRGR